jgi:hypothetical protein
VKDVTPLGDGDYEPAGGTPLLDAIGEAIEKVKAFHGDALDSKDLNIIVTVYTDGEENASLKWKKDDVKKMIDYLQKERNWTFTFVGCGSFENVSATSAAFGISSANTVAVADSFDGRSLASKSISTSYMSYSRAVKSNVVDSDLFKKSVAPQP